MKKHRIVMVETSTAFGETVKWYAVQVRVAIFWWVTISYMSSLSMARYYIRNGHQHKKEKVVKVFE